MVQGLDRGCPAIPPPPPRALPSLLPGGHPTSLRRHLPDQATRRGRAASHRAWPDRLVGAADVDLEQKARTFFGEYVAAKWWPAWKDQHPTSEYGTRKKVEKRILPTFGNIPLSELDASTIGAWKSAMLAEQLSPQTVNTYPSVRLSVCRSLGPFSTPLWTTTTCPVPRWCARAAPATHRRHPQPAGPPA